METPLAQPDPEDKDWTFVLNEPCPECGFVAADVDVADLPSLVRAVTTPWAQVLAAPDAAVRPAPQVWSPLEYACHVRDVFALADYRVRLMLAEDDPLFANWDQDATAIESDYASADADDVRLALARTAEGFAVALEAVPDDAWERPGRRGDGASFTIDSFARYLLHDPIHHLTDVTGERWG